MQEVRRNDADGRYELVVDDRLVGIADFALRGEAVVMPHTEINPQLQGQGLGAVLVQGALDDIRSAGRTVVPACWYVRQFIDEHPDYADMVA